jgi:putative transposase
LRIHLRAYHAASLGTYGSPRLVRDLRGAGLHIGRNRVMRLMRAEQLIGRPRRRFRVTTLVDPHAPVAPNRLAQQFARPRLNDVWAGDITAIATREGFVYLAVLLDLCSRRIVGWALESTLDTRLVLAAWRHAVGRRGQAPRLHHSDRGIQYTSAAYQAELRRHHVACSMSGKGNCFDNAVVESFFATLKTDLDHRVWPTRREAADVISAYIERFYNTRRRHSSLNYQSPAEFEARRRVAA